MEEGRKGAAGGKLEHDIPLIIIIIMLMRNSGSEVSSYRHLTGTMSWVFLWVLLFPSTCISEALTSHCFNISLEHVSILRQTSKHVNLSSDKVNKKHENLNEYEFPAHQCGCSIKILI